RIELRSRPVAQEGKRDMEVRTRDDAHVARAEVFQLPRLDDVERRLRQTKAEEEAKPLIDAHATRRIHTTSSELRVGGQKCANRVQRGCNGPRADRVAVAGHVELAPELAAGAHRMNVDEPDGLLGRGAVRPGDARHPYRDVRAEPLTYALRHGCGNLRRHG